MKPATGEAARAASSNVAGQRLDPAPVARIIAITPSVAANDGTRVDILQLVSAATPPGFKLDFVGVLVDGIDQMAKPLPNP